MSTKKPQARPRDRRMRSTPPPPTFSLAALADDAVLTQIEVAAVQRKAVTTVEKGRYDGTDGLDWRYIDGWPRCTAGSLKKRMQGDPVVRRPSVAEYEQAKRNKIASTKQPALKPVPRQTAGAR